MIEQKKEKGKDMNKRKLKFALFGNIYQAKKSAYVQQVLDVLSSYQADIYIESEFYHYISGTLKLDTSKCHIFFGRDFETDIAISMGGDGTFLHAASSVGDKNIPILGINTGRLGFIADISPNEIKAMFDAIYSNDYLIEERTIIQIENQTHPLDGYPYALNEVAVLKHDNSSMISVKTFINGDLLTTYLADGIIICTPTGSTGYSLSVGGPIMVPRSSTFALTAIAPHSLNVRPIVFCDDVEVTLVIESRSRQFLVAIDGRSESCRDKSILKLKKAPYTLKLIKNKKRKFFNTLREKMMWGADQRQD